YSDINANRIVLLCVHRLARRCFLQPKSIWEGCVSVFVCLCECVCVCVCVCVCGVCVCVSLLVQVCTLTYAAVVMRHLKWKRQLGVEVHLEACAGQGQCASLCALPQA